MAARPGLLAAAAAAVASDSGRRYPSPTVTAAGPGRGDVQVPGDHSDDGGRRAAQRRMRTTLNHESPGPPGGNLNFKLIGPYRSSPARARPGPAGRPGPVPPVSLPGPAGLLNFDSSLPKEELGAARRIPKSTEYVSLRDTFFLFSIWKPIPVHKPPILCHTSPMDMTWILQHQVYFLAKCHIHIISMSYLFQKRYIWIYLVYPKLKKLHLVYTWYIFPCHMPCLSMSYPCPKFVRLCGSGPQMKFSRKLNCCSSSAYHSTAFIKHNKIYLPPPAVRRARGLLLFPGLDTAGAGSCAPAGPAGAGAGLSAGSAGAQEPAQAASPPKAGGKGGVRARGSGK